MNCLICQKRAYSEYCVQHKPRKPIQTKAVLKRGENSIPARHCIRCDSFEHTKSQCPYKTPKFEDAVPGPDGRYPDRKRYLIGFKEKWGRTRQQWKNKNPPNHAGNYHCHYCHIAIPAAEMQLDHKIPRSRAPELRYELSNLTPSCGLCNFNKGSIEHDNYEHDCYDKLNPNDRKNMLGLLETKEAPHQGQD